MSRTRKSRSGGPGTRSRGSSGVLPGRNGRAVAVFLLPPLLVYLATVAFPIGESLFLSFFRWDGITAMKFIGLDNYRTLLTTDTTFRSSALHSVIYLAINLVIQLGGALLVANALTYLRRGRDTLRVLYLLPAVLSTVAIALLFQRIYSSEPEGLINQMLGAVGLDGLARPWLSDIHTALVSVSVPEGWRFMGLYTVILLAGLLTVPREVEEAARLDGASETRIFFQIRMPHLRPVWLTTLVMATTYGLRGFDVPYLLTNGGPGVSTELLTTYMYKTAFTSTDYGYSSAISVFIVAECVVAVGIIVALLRRRGEALL
ncbi:MULTISPECIES: carbohydrate ABC transporter permease [unclassified Streptomyces]|uniref:carbohydrate ABC transporter permease n=1 Tax=unclassified Streptomyces TaxID=2593676 RepID=UPI002E2EC88D|nr:sugar ABC transporter permease [Streptomyces sp. NBC_01716]